MGRRADFHNEREPGLLGIQPGTVLAGASVDAITLAGMRFVNEGLCEIDLARPGSDLTRIGDHG
jgi:hypothetical protein